MVGRGPCGPGVGPLLLGVDRCALPFRILRGGSEGAKALPRQSGGDDLASGWVGGAVLWETWVGGWLSCRGNLEGTFFLLCRRLCGRTGLLCVYIYAMHFCLLSLGGSEA